MGLDCLESMIVLGYCKPDDRNEGWGTFAFLEFAHACLRDTAALRHLRLGQAAFLSEFANAIGEATTCQNREQFARCPRRAMPRSMSIEIFV